MFIRRLLWLGKWYAIQNPIFVKIVLLACVRDSAKKASITIKSVGSVMCKTDLQKTYRKSGMKCTLLDGTNEVGFSCCIEKCPLEPEKYL